MAASKRPTKKETPNPRILRAAKKKLDLVKQGRVKTISHTQLLRDCLRWDAARAAS